jgi:hypothetical protein
MAECRLRFCQRRVLDPQVRHCRPSNARRFTHAVTSFTFALQYHDVRLRAEGTKHCLLG